MSIDANDLPVKLAAMTQRQLEVELALSREVALRKHAESQLLERREHLDAQRIAALNIAQDAAEACERLQQRTQQLAQSNQELTKMNGRLERLRADAQQSQVAALNMLYDADEARGALASKAAELQRSNTELEEFAYVASHDLKSPLSAIKNLALWIQEDTAELLPQKSQRHLAQMQQRVARLERLLDDLLQYSRAGRVHGQIVPVDSERMVQDIVGQLDRPLSCRVSVASGMPRFDTARIPLELVIRNLINNAIKHRDRDDLRVEISCQENGRFFEFTVADNGPGIDARFHEQVFKLFETLRPRDELEGSGMGLAIVKKTVES